MTNRERLCGTILRGRQALTALTLAMALSVVGCAQSNAQVTAQNERARLALDVLVEIDRVLESGFNLDVAKLNLAMAQLLPKVECQGLAVARLNLETAQMSGSSKASLLRAEADTAAIRHLSSKAKPSAADFDSGQPAREVAEKIVQAMLAVNSPGDEKLVTTQVEVETLSAGCLTEEYQRAVDAGEILQNEFLAKHARSSGDRIAALVRNVALKQLFDARSASVTRSAEARRARAEASVARSKVTEIQNKVATPELRASREGLAAALRNVPTTLK